MCPVEELQDRPEKNMKPNGRVAEVVLLSGCKYRREHVKFWMSYKDRYYV